jgi:hypothetical protein
LIVNIADRVGGEVDLQEQVSWFQGDFESTVAEIEALKDLADLILSDEEEISAESTVDQPTSSTGSAVSESDKVKVKDKSDSDMAQPEHGNKKRTAQGGRAIVGDCPKCGKQYKRSDFLRKHISDCQTAKRTGTRSRKMPANKSDVNTVTG